MKPPKKRARRSGEFEFVKYSTGSVIAPMIAFMSSTLFFGRQNRRPARSADPGPRVPVLV
jgi:hypothetical protein